MDTMIADQDGLPQFPLKHLVRYVDYANGNDGAAATRGLGPGYAYKTIQAAYNELKTTAVANYTALGSSDELAAGTIMLLPGDHDVGGSGLAIDSKRPVDVYGVPNGHHTHAIGTSASRIVSSSGSVTQFVRISHSGGVGHGTAFRGVAFIVDQATNTALTSILYYTDVDDFIVEDCQYDTLDSTTNQNIPFIYQESLTSGDAAWARIIGVKGSRLALYKGDGIGGNFNRMWVSQNRIFYGGSIPMFWLNGNTSNSNWVVANNFEGDAIAVQLGSTGSHKGNVFSNGGEGSGGAGDTTNPFYECLGSVNLNYFMGGECHLSGGANGMWIRFDTNAYSNSVFAAADPVGTAGFKRKIVDTSTYGNRVFDPRWGEIAKVKTGTTPTIGDGDFASAPPDGAKAYTYGSTGPVYKEWIRLNGVWKSAAFT
jgi:hypothetical protein